MREILGVQLDAKAGRIAAAHHVRRAMHEVPARAGAGAERRHHAIERQLVRAGERHGFGAGADDAGAHDLVGGLGGLAGARGTEMFDGLAHGREDRARAFESGGVTARHDGERAVLRAFDTAADRRVDELRRVRRETASAQRAVSALTVEQSMTSAPWRKPGARPSTTARTSASAETQITTASSHAAKSASVAGDWQPSSAASASALSRLRFQTASSSPATMEIFRHGSTHGTETCKADAHHRRELSGASATKENAVQRTAFIEHLNRLTQPCGPQMASTALAAFDALLRELGVGRGSSRLPSVVGAIHATRADGLAGRSRALSCNARRVKLRDLWRRSRRRASCPALRRCADCWRRSWLLVRGLAARRSCAGRLPAAAANRCSRSTAPGMGLSV